jgi:hypothetical protein
VGWTLVALGALMDGRRWAIPLEVLRLAALAAALAAWRPFGLSTGSAAAAAVAVAAASAVALLLATRAPPDRVAGAALRPGA